MTKLDLRIMSLCTACTRDHAAVARAIKKSCSIIEFGEIVVFTDDSTAFQFLGIDHIIPINRFDTYEDVSIWAMTVLPFYSNMFSRRHIMGIHWDGFPVNTDAWDNEFLEYDFIGAPWPDGVVGNDGFCIQSRKFLATVCSLNILPSVETCHPHDAKLFRDTDGGYRGILEDRCIKVAPTELASRFSAEDCDYSQQFGFHGKHTLVDLYRKGVI